jgi:hypothetical protein
MPRLDLQDDAGVEYLLFEYDAERALVIDRADLVRLVGLIGDANWNFARKRRSVRCDPQTAWYPRIKTGSGKYVQAARLIAEAGEDEEIHYRDDNPMNLRRSNLERVPQSEAREYRARRWFTRAREADIQAVARRASAAA